MAQEQSASGKVISPGNRSVETASSSAKHEGGTAAANDRWSQPSDGCFDTGSWIPREEETVSMVH